MRADLHAHTNLSDGVLTPARLVEAAARSGVEALAITDHDTVAAVRGALEAALALPLRIVPGMEVSAHHGGVQIHVLAYFGPGALERLGGFQELRRRARQGRLEEMLRRLDRLGIALDRAAVERGGDPRRSPGRPHVARALVAGGHVASEAEAFERLLGRGCPAYVDDQGPSAAEAIAMIHELPGLAVLAHPGFDGADALFDELAALGLDGIEAFHPGHEPERAAAFRRRALDLGLLVTGGSDFHGSTEDPQGASAHERLGRVAWPQDEQERFLAALDAR